MPTPFPPELYRLVRENPEIAVEMLGVLKTTERNLTALFESDIPGLNLIDLLVWRDAVRISITRSSANHVEVSRIAHAHYTNLAREAAERNGEEILREHLA